MLLLMMQKMMDGKVHPDLSGEAHTGMLARQLLKQEWEKSKSWLRESLRKTKELPATLPVLDYTLLCRMLPRIAYHRHQDICIGAVASQQ